MSSAPRQPTSTPKPGDKTWGGATGSNLYLATFLATLFLLLIGSCCIVVRSYIMRRRMRRHIRDLLTVEGMGRTPPKCRCRKRRPKFHDRWISPAVGSSWPDIMPLSLRVVFGKRSSKAEEPRGDAKAETKRLGLKSWSSSSGISITHEIPDGASPPAKIEIAQVSVLIEMPSRERSALYGRPKPQLKSTEDDEDVNEFEALPELVLGFARCHKHWWIDVVADTIANSARERTTDTHHPHPRHPQ